ncbi:Scr1 family TA system antitoxin-like transcriptional regulator [Streptomyces bambusae]|uniref:Scr1 family TA system antitoxin-like transcriptional regulator n=1 Tax=Streptomyces bambusae TaxID=1550616 RepID=UPI001CFF906E|nr:Scr1 family TA system antitoxin-like transcriptional regulator [Streptomyces bambusae]MCB5170140.1 Scr1 family TA system antitoxin-like transcriptional regulator [Streptomyces bambusae]
MGRDIADRHDDEPEQLPPALAAASRTGDLAGARVAYRVFGEFHVLDFDYKELPDPVVVASSTVDQGVKCLSKPRPVKQFVRRFDYLAQGALPAHETPAFLKRLAREVSTA